jgi:glycosyltransferase involved in cell wall biosynthesis
MMRIALLGPANSIHLQRWAHALVARGHAVCVLSQHPCERALLPAEAELFMLPRRGALGYFTNAWRARTVLSRWRPDVLNAHYASGYGTTASLCGAWPLLLSVWGSDVYDFPYQGAFKGRLMRRNLRRATAIASTSHAMARQVQRLVPAITDIAVTPFGVDLALFTPDAARRDEAQVTLGTVKSLAPKYGVDLLLCAFAGLVHDPRVQGLPRACRLLIVGDGPQRAELEALAAELGIAPRTTFAGAVPHHDVPAWLNRLDIYAAPSRLDSESFGVAVIEAGACALPVVVSNAGGLPEVVRDGETGLVVPRDDVPALQAALTRLVLDAALRERLGARGREHVAREYDWVHCVELMEAACEGTIAKAANAARR